MVEYSLCVAIFAFVPYLIDATVGSEVVAWRISSFALAAAWSAVGLSAGARARKIFGKSAFSVAPGFSAITNVLGYTGAGILLLNAFGLPIRSAGASYIVGLFLPLLQSALYFLRMVAHGDPLNRSAE
jgi:hypothetical protein